MSMLVLLLAFATQASPPDRVVLAATANARVAPSTTAQTVMCGQVPIGTELPVVGRLDGWIETTYCGRQAFISAVLTRAITDASRHTVREQVLRERLARTDASLEAASRLIAIVESWGRDEWLDREARGRYALYRLQAIRLASESTRNSALSTGRFAMLLGERSPILFYNEVGGSWMLRNEYILSVHDEFRGTSAADDIAWFAVENGLGGECEGDVVCYLTSLDRLVGEYLRRHPAGASVRRALATVSAWLAHVEPWKPLVPDVAPAESCRPLREPLDRLTMAVRGAKADTKATLAVLAAVAAGCQ